MRIYFVSFARMARMFGMHWKFVRRGDVMMQEFILIKRIGVFRVLSKNTYTEISLGRIEREHGDVVCRTLE